MYLKPMLDEVLTTEERAAVARAKAFAEAHVGPNAARWEWERRYPLETIKAACAQGLNTIELASCRAARRGRAWSPRSSTPRAPRRWRCLRRRASTSSRRSIPMRRASSSGTTRPSSR
ncbi:MAG: acyl-CoA dehydrogenase family protein, partial [Rhodospirillales bacterium]|nr:acyl-CoA dehydrogenase family protein [Rhodospirillales bacterium]